MDIREKVARAIHAVRPVLSPNWDAMEDDSKQFRIEQADAAFLACDYQKIREALDDARFLLDRLSDHGDCGFTETGARNWYRHVEPAIARASKSIRSAL